ncbi:MAG TPA: hypothetical protein VFA54_06705 [Bryobacterales bacterium]|jgi:hypothetical protein|nr:hypothetical protein [Bryobacterales bacterium]
MPQNATARRSLLPSLSDMIFSTTLAFLFLFGKGATTLLGDSDTGWHIRTGEWILQNHAVPRHDLFSFSKPGGEWFAWEWLSDVLFALVHRYAGLAGLVLLAGLVIALVFTFLYRFMVRRGANVLLATALAVTASYAASIHWLARPHIFSWAFALIFYWVLEEAPVERNAIFWLAPLTILWTNLHGSFVVGLFLIALYGAGELVQAALAAGEDTAAIRRGALRRAGRYALLLAVSGAASLVNPYFYKVHVHIFGYLKNAYILDHITEFFSPNFHAAPERFFEILLLGGIASALWAWRQGRYTEALLVVSFAHFSLQSARHVPLYAILAAPLIAAALTDSLAPHHTASWAAWARGLAGAFGRFGEDIARMDRAPRVYAASAMVTLLVVAMLWSPASSAGLQDFHPRFNPKLFPVAAADFLERSSFSGNVFSTDQWSSYLIYREFPRVRVFMDGRSDYYGPKLGELYLDLINVHHAWERTFQQYGVETVVLPVDSGLVGALKESPHWKVAYDDGIAIVFERAASAPARLVASVRGAGRREQ